MSILLIMWTAKQTKKGMTKADTAIKRRSQIRQEKRMTKLGMNIPQFYSSLPDLAEDPFIDQHLEEKGLGTYDALELPSNQILATLPPEAAAAVAKFVANENESRKTYQVEHRRSLNLSRDKDTNGFPIDIKLDFGEHMTQKRHTAPVPPRAHTSMNEMETHRASISELREDGKPKTRLSYVERLLCRKEEDIHIFKPVKKARPASRLFRRMSRWRTIPASLPKMMKSAEAGSQ